jgi:transposase
VLVEAAWHATRTPGPLRAFHQRIAVRRGGNIATVAVARKLAVIAWHMLSRGEDYAFSRPSLTREKLRRLELMTGAKHQKGKRIGVFVTKEQHRLDKAHAAKQRGRRQPHLLRFSSRSPAPKCNSRKGAAHRPAT